MISHFLNLERKQFFRSASFGKSIAIKIIMGFFAIYFLAVFLILGTGGYYILKKQFPEQDPLVLVNSFLLFVIISDLVLKYIMQKLPVMNIKPLLTLPIKKNKIVHYILAKSSISFFNIIGLFFYISFAVVLIKEEYDVSGVLGWLAAMILVIQSSNFLNFLINKNNIALGGLLVLLIGGYLVQYFELFNLAGFVGKGFDFVYTNPIYVILFLVLLVVLYVLNYKQLRSEIYLDAAVSEKTKEVNTADLSFADKLGDLAPFIKNDLRLLWRNKRTKSSVWMLLGGLLYGLFFYPQPVYADKES